MLANNAAWIAVAGDGARLPKSAEQGGLFAAIGRPGAAKPGALCCGAKAGPTAARLSVLDQRRYLVELLVEPALPVAEARFRPVAAAAEGPTRRPAELDAFAAAAPFGAALLDGDDPATAAIVRANAALEAMAGKGERWPATSLADADRGRILGRGRAGGRRRRGRPVRAAPGPRPGRHRPALSDARAGRLHRLSWSTCPSRSRWSCSWRNRRRCAPSASSSAASRTTSTICLPPSRSGCDELFAAPPGGRPLLPGPGRAPLHRRPRRRPGAQALGLFAQADAAARGARAGRPGQRDRGPAAPRCCARTSSWRPTTAATRRSCASTRASSRRR